MDKYYLLNVFLFRILLPILISTCIIFRPSGISAIYLLVMFYLPFVPVPHETTMPGHSGVFLKILIGISVLTALCQATFQIALLALPPYAQFLQDDPLIEKILRHVGLVRLNEISPEIVLRWLSPEFLMVAIAVAYYVSMRKLTVTLVPDNDIDELSRETRVTLKNSYESKNSGNSVLVAIGRYLVLLSLCSAAVLRPSVVGGLYFLVFLSAATYWASYKQLRKGFAIFMCCILPIVFLHLSCFYAYQFQWPQELLEKNNTYARLFGLTPLILSPSGNNDSVSAIAPFNTTLDGNTAIENNSTSKLNATSIDGLDDDPRNFVFADVEWASFVNPIVLYILYYIVVLECKELLKPEALLVKPDIEPGETTPLIRGVSPSKKGSGKRSGIFQDSTGSVTATGDNTEDIPMDELGTIEDEYEPTVLENILFALESVAQLIVRSSYIGTNIIMMAWSITYLSWLTFVLLIWANLIWLVPNQRKSMLRSSPFLVFYAWFLLISAYVYSMDLTEAELPSSIQGFNLSEIGLVKMLVLPCMPLFVKCAYTVMFWVTLRQYMQERKEQKQSNALADMVAPLQVTVGTAAGVNREQDKKGSKIMERIGQHLKKFLTKFWIWVVAVTLFAVAITGQRMTGFRILYMALFLIFVLSFQFSFQLWRRIMFGFWLTVIIYSMVILVLVYTYQFENFPSYWTEYLHIPQEQQLDIGLEQFKTKQLFVRLVTPTVFVIITVIQLHYFHNDFMTLSDPKNTNIASNNEVAEDLEQSSMQGGAYIDRSIKEDASSPLQFDLYDLEHYTSAQFQQLLRHWLERLHRIKNLVYLFLELHMIKVVLLFAMLLCVYDMCALYLIIIVLISFALTFGRPMQLFAIYFSSLLVSILLLARMIYQIQYITPANWNVNCTIIENPDLNQTTKNNAPWLGFQKMDEADRSLSSLVKWNVIYIVIVTLWAVVLVRQHKYRVMRGRPTTRAFFMFPNITRAEADNNLKNCLKYLANYGFYKFGVEICLMFTVAVIGTRMDLYSVLYSVWLCILFSMKRSFLSRVWVFYLIFLAIALPFQYLMAVGLPPTLCQEFPWDRKDQMWRSLQDWAFLLDNYHPPPVKKLILDFILLLLVSRQWVVFRIERRYSGNYAGGSNDSIIHHAEEKGFVNPVPDFITYVRSYLDIFKRGILQSFLWITLALVFLAGTNRVNIFSLGYLLGAFVFLWHGSDLYLRPISTILKQWQLLLGYNVAVIFIKTAFQILGCIFIHNIPTNCCWLVQLLGIGCVRKFDVSLVNSRIAESTDSTYCTVPREFIGIAWDGLCFALLIMQRRIFNSYNFFHIVDETKATTILASRGAELIEEMREKTMNYQEEVEHRVLEKIKLKMDRIKRNQQKIQDSVEKGRRKYRVKHPVTNKQAIRSGDYYMFDELDDEEIDLLPEEQDEEDNEDEMKSRKPDMSELLITAIKSDVSTAIQRQSSQLGLRRQYSMPLSRQKSARSQMSAAFSAPPTIDENEPRSVRIQEEPEGDDIQPGTSKDDDISELSEPKETFCKKILRVLLFIWAFIESVMTSLTNFLNKYSRDYRYVLRVLAKEKKILKEKTAYNVGSRIGPGHVWQPAGSYHSLLRQSLKSYSTHVLLEIEEMSSYDQPTIVRLLLAIWYIIMSQSEILCYFVIFLNQMKTATFLSLPLPLMVFFWGSLTIPRPSKTFWVTIIAYTEVIVLLKCMFQFDIMPGNTRPIYESNTFSATKLIGLYRQENYATWDLLLLLVVFFHRVLLKSLGIWTTAPPATTAVLTTGDYRLEDGQLIPVSSSSPKLSQRQRQVKLDPSDIISRRSSDSSRISEQEEIVEVKVKRHVKLHKYSHALQMSLIKYGEAVRRFINQLLDPTSRVAADVYSLMFLCDFLNFFVILFGYSAFGTQPDGGVSSYLEDNRVPPLFLFMLILQFMLLVIDRAIYLRKNILAKIIFQFIQIIVLHIWLFVVFPIITGSTCNTVLPPQIYYMAKCSYLLLSAFQIRCGYPTRILGNFLCKGYGLLNMCLFRGFMLVPFLFELRTCMDWMWTETSMTIFDWIKMEDIFAHVFLLKCSRQCEDEFPQPRGQKKKHFSKYLMGGGGLITIIAIIWFPLVFFSLGNAVGGSNVPFDVTLEIRIGPYEPIYKMSAQSNSIFAFSSPQLDDLKVLYDEYKSSETFIYNYEATDIAAVKLSTDSGSIWGISPPDRKRMVAEVNSTQPLQVRLTYIVSHKTSKKEDSGIIQKNIPIIIPAQTEERENLLRMLEGESTEPILFQYILPKFLKVTNRGTAEPISDLMMDIPTEGASLYRNITINLNKTLDQEWWRIREECDDWNYRKFLNDIPFQDCANSIILYTFNDKIFPDTLEIISGAGIIGLYTTLVFVASRLSRGFVADQCSKIMFDDMPNVDRVLQLCLDVYLVREACEFALEEDLFAKLVFLFRSPETLIKWTRPKEELAEDEDPEAEDQ